MPAFAEKVADAMGAVQFVIVSTVVIAAWTVVNHVATFLQTSWQGLLHGRGFDRPRSSCRTLCSPLWPTTRYPW